MSTFVLIHGSWHGGWCWDRIVPSLEAAGHRVVAPDLPGHGADRTPLAEISLHAYVDRIGEVLDVQPEPVILVGHSVGGFIVTQAAEARPDKISHLIYLCAFLLGNGECPMRMGGEHPVAIVPPYLAVDQTRGLMLLKPNLIRETFYNDCSDADAAFAEARLVPEPLAPVATPLRTTPDRFGRIPRVYIETQQDHALPNSLQRQMLAAMPCQRVFSLPTGHSPFFAAPAGLADRLIAVGGQRMSG